MKKLALIVATILMGLGIPEELPAADQFIVVVLDDSGSMNSNMRSVRSRKMTAAKQALRTVLADIPEDAQVGVIALNSRVNGSRWIVPLGPVDRRGIQQRIDAIRATGSTPLGVSMKVAADALLQARGKNVYGTYRLLIVTDGEATDPDLVEKYLPDIRSRGVITDVIGVDMSGQHSLATKVNTYRRADNPESLTQAIAEVFAETSDEDAGAGQSDYDLLGGLDDDVARAAVISLASMNNQPIGPSGSAAPEESVQTQPPTTRRPQPPTQRSSPPTRQPRDAGGSAIGSVCFGAFFVLVVLAAFFTMAAKLGRRR